MKQIHLGVDIEEVDRFKSLLRNQRFLKRVFTPQEIRYCQSKAKNAAQHFAVRYAAKEAVWKALSEVFRRQKKQITHNKIGIKKTPTGKPLVMLPASVKRWERKISVSLSHTKAYATAVAIVSE